MEQTEECSLILSDSQRYEIDNFSKKKYIISKEKGMASCVIRRLIGRQNYKRNSYYGRRINGINDANAVIASMLEGGDPFLVGRFGDAELRTLIYYIERSHGMRGGYPEYIRTAMHRNAGFFPTDDSSLDEYGALLLAACWRLDLVGVWYNLLEDYVIDHYCNKPFLSELESLEPYRCANPWSKALRGKKVLVVHPFAKSISRQYGKRKLLFDDEAVLPEFELVVYKSVQSNAGAVPDYASWFEAFSKMLGDIRSISFDVAIVGCGSYGLPLAAMIKEMGKQAVHLGGATQILFGIKGARWDKKPEVSKFFNDSWVRPLAEERPPDTNSVEGGCYW